jgi:high-affinity iron transporter
MLAEFIVSFREFFEIALIAGIAIAYLLKTGGKERIWIVYASVALAALASIAAAALFGEIAGGFEEHEEMFEASVSLFSSLLIGSLALAMLKGGKLLKPDKGWESPLLGLAVFASVFREGIEIILMLGAIWLSSKALDLLAVIGGAAFAFALAYLSFKSIIKLDIKKFMQLTGAALLAFAAWLFFQGIAGALGIA